MLVKGDTGSLDYSYLGSAMGHALSFFMFSASRAWRSPDKDFIYHFFESGIS